MIQSNFSDQFSLFLDVLYDTVMNLIAASLQLLPTLFIIFSVPLVLKFFQFLISPKYELKSFDSDFESEFDLYYESMRDSYESEKDLINDYFSDFHYFDEDEPNLDELFEAGIWDNISYDYYDFQSLFIDDYQSNFEFSYDEFDGSFTDFVENSEE